MQSAVRGGDCARNIRRICRHFSGAGVATRQGLPAAPPPLWLRLLGEVAVPLWEVIHTGVEGELVRCPAALFADQSKAFER
eukprot:5470429-Alexandrium_andersonii.AAC.1